MADFLAAQGFTAYSVAGGTSTWARSGRDVVTGTTPTNTDHDTVTSGAITVVPIETPTLGDRTYLVHDGEVAVVVDPQRDVDRVLPSRRPRGVRLPTCSRPTSTTTTSPAGTRWPDATGRRLPRQRRRRRLLRPHPRPGRRRRGRRRPDAGDRRRDSGHTFTHLSYALTDDAPRRAASRCSPAARCCSAPPDGPTCSAPTHTDDLVRAPARLRPPARRRAAGRRRGLPTHGFGSFCSATQSEATASTIGRRSAAQPGADPGRGGLRRRPAGRPGRLPGVLRAHGPRQRRRARGARPVRTRRRPTPPSCAAASRPVSGWSTCATGPPSPPATCPAR